MSHPHSQTIDVWSVGGVFDHLIYSPKGAIEGFLIRTDDIPTQFVIDAHDMSVAGQLSALRSGQLLVVEGTECPPSPKGEADHTVYAFERLASVDGGSPEAAPPHESTRGKVMRLNYARHGAPNGVELDNGDFVHTRPDGMKRLDLKVGDLIQAEGTATSLTFGRGRAIEAHRVNGRSLADGR